MQTLTQYKTMEPLGGFSQEELNRIWQSLHSEESVPTAEIIVDDEVEQVMTINTEEGQVSVSRTPNGQWSDTSD